LRLRSLPEEKIAEILTDVSGVAYDSGRSPREEFGDPQRYAQEFPKGRQRSAGGRILLVAAILSAVALVANVNAGLFFDASIAPAGLPLALWTAAFLAVATVVGILLDRRLPYGFRRPTVTKGTGQDA
jgi:hypothetical protein